MKKIYKLNKIFNLLISLFICISFFCGCSVNKSNKTNNSDNNIQNKSSTVSLGISEKNNASSCTTILNIPATTVPSSSKMLKNNPYPTLSVPTDVTKIGDTFFIVDCYHSQIIYNNDLSAPLTEWKVLTDEESSGYKMGHTIVGDNKGLFMADDTENNTEEYLVNHLLHGTYTTIFAPNESYVLQSYNGEVGFRLVRNKNVPVCDNSAYLITNSIKHDFIPINQNLDNLRPIINNCQQKAYAVYDITGKKLRQVKRGVNILKYSNGEVKKVIK